MAEQPLLVMTGGSSGIGRRALDELLASRRHWRVILLARRSSHADALADQFRSNARFELVTCDLADLHSVDSACREVIGRVEGQRLDALLFNAAVQMTKGDQVSRDGLEITFGVNHLAHFLIGERLRSRLGPNGRIIVTSSEVHDPAAFCLIGIARGRWQEPRDLAHPVKSQEGRWTASSLGEARYSISKLLNLMYVRWLAHQQADVTVAAFNPSVVPGTQIARDRGILVQLGWQYVLEPLAGILPGTRSMETSARDLVWLVEEAGHGDVHGQYVNGRVVEAGSPDSRDTEKIAKVIEESRKLLEEAGLAVPGSGAELALHLPQ